MGRPASILLIRPPEPGRDSQFSLGMGYIARALTEAGFGVETLTLDLHDLEDVGVLRHIAERPHKIFGVGGMYGSFPGFIRVCRLIRLAVPDAQIILGGALPTSCPEFTLRMTGADIACIGPAEDTVVAVMEALVGGGDLDAIDSLCLQTGGAQHRTGGRTRSDLAHQRGGRALPSHGQRSWPHWELFDGAAYVAGGAYYPFAPGSRVAPVLSARGCPYSCNFCFQPSPYGTRELDDVFDEMQWLIERYRLDGFYVEDDLFMLDRRRVLAFCQGLMRRGIRTRFTVTGRFNIVDAELLTALREAGCVTVFYGGESADQDVLDDMKKKTTVEQMRQGVELTRAHGLFTRVGFMFGQPHDTRETLEQTVSFLTEIAIGHFEPRYIYGCVPFPATELFDHCVRHGLLRDHEDLYRRFEFKERLLDQLPVNMTAIRDVPVKQLLDDANARLARIYSERSGEWLQFFREAPAPPPSAARRPSLSVVP